MIKTAFVNLEEQKWTLDMYKVLLQLLQESKILTPEEYQEKASFIDKAY